MDLLTELANWIWLQQRVDMSAIRSFFALSPAQSVQLLQRLEQLGVVSSHSATEWQATAMPAHFFQKKGRSTWLRLTLYERPYEGGRVIGVIAAEEWFLTHQQTGDWWLACNARGVIGYIHLKSLRLRLMDT